MSYGVICQNCRCYEEAHDPETGECKSSGQWGKCDCKQLVLPADADEQREFRRQMNNSFSLR